MNIIKNYYQWIVAVVVVLAVCLGCYFSFKLQPKPESVVVAKAKKDSKIITVFIHGSLYPDESFIDIVSLSDLNTILFDTVEDDSEYVKSLKRARSNPASCGEQIMLAEGLQEIHDSHIAQLCDFEDTAIESIPDAKPQEHHCSCCHKAAAHPTPKKKRVSKDTRAAHYAIACYSALMDNLFPTDDTSYYTFGHLGVLSHRYREAVAKTFYQELLKKVRHAQEEYDNVKVIIVAHSHGGTISLNMAAVENELKKGLIIDELILFGTPLQPETAPYAAHPMFKRVMNCYSLGDTVQGCDVLTTASRKCHNTFSSTEVVNLQSGKIYDIQLIVNDDTHAVTHAKMWYIDPKDKNSSHVDPLPYAVMAPAIMAALDAEDFGSSVQAFIQSKDDHLAVEVKDARLNDLQYLSPNTYDIVAKMRDRAVSHITREHA